MLLKDECGVDEKYDKTDGWELGIEEIIEVDNIEGLDVSELLVGENDGEVVWDKLGENDELIDGMKLGDEDDTTVGILDGIDDFRKEGLELGVWLGTVDT